MDAIVSECRRNTSSRTHVSISSTDIGLFNVAARDSKAKHTMVPSSPFNLVVLIDGALARTSTSTTPSPTCCNICCFNRSSTARAADAVRSSGIVTDISTDDADPT